MTSTITLPEHVAPAGGVQPATDRRLRIASYNIQAGLSHTRPHHYLTHSWKYLWPHRRSLSNLDRMARVLESFDLVALQEADAGSLRSSFVNQTEYLAERGGYPFWFSQMNRDLGDLARISNGLLSRYPLGRVAEHPLPGLPGRGALLTKLGDGPESLAVVAVHLALGRRARARQIGFLNELISGYRHVVLLGDMNTEPGSPELRSLCTSCDLNPVTRELRTFPSWRPSRGIDHVLVSEELTIASGEVLPHPYSDHLPVGVDLVLPADLDIGSCW